MNYFIFTYIYVVIVIKHIIIFVIANINFNEFYLSVCRIICVRIIIMLFEFLNEYILICTNILMLNQKYLTWIDNFVIFKYIG